MPHVSLGWGEGGGSDDKCIDTIVPSKLRNDRFLGGLSVIVLSITKDIFVDLDKLTMYNYSHYTEYKIRYNITLSTK